MRLVRYHVAVSLDGFIAPPDGAADWLEPYGKVAMGFIGPWMKQIGGIIVGRKTYDQAIGNQHLQRLAQRRSGTGIERRQLGFGWKSFRTVEFTGIYPIFEIIVYGIAFDCFQDGLLPVPY